VTLPVFLPILESKAKQTAFFIAPAATPQSAAQIATQQNFHILQNDANIQAIQFADGMVLAAFYAPGELATDGQMRLVVDQPCLVLQNKNGLWLSDPAQKGGHVNITSSGKTFEVTLPSDGSSVLAK
jgi:hypothetical protein